MEQTHAMHKPLAISLLGVLLGVLSGCALRVDYVGVREAALPKDAPVAVYIEQSAVGRAFDVMGHARCEADDSTSMGEIQDAIVDKAREVGADAVLIRSAESVVVGHRTEATSAYPYAGYPCRSHGHSGCSECYGAGAWGGWGGGWQWASTTYETYDIRHNVVEADLIRFR